MDDFRNDDLAEVADSLRIDNAELDLSEARERLFEARKAIDNWRETNTEYRRLVAAYYDRLREFSTAEKRVHVLKGTWEGPQYQDYRRAERLREVCDL